MRKVIAMPGDASPGPSVIFDSGKDCADWACISPSAIHIAIKNGSPVCPPGGRAGVSRWFVDYVIEDG